MRNFSHFLQYHNAIPIALGILVIGSGVTFAATNPETIYSSQQQVLSIDNSYIVNKDLSNWSPQVRINSVTEDADNYYVDYSLSTIDLEGYRWQDIAKLQKMSVSKADLGQYRDLGVYVTQQLRQVVDRERQRLADTQDIEKKQVSSATIATSYGGLIGQFITDKTETLEGYTPVVTAPSGIAGGSFSGPSGVDGSAATAGATGNISAAQVGLQVLGNNPARLDLRSSYADLGVALLDPFNTNVGIHTFVDGKEVITPQLDTSTTTSYVIEYRVTDLRGVSVLVRRIVLVGDAPDPGTEINEAGNVAPAVISAAPAVSTASSDVQVGTTVETGAINATTTESMGSSTATTTQSGSESSATSTQAVATTSVPATATSTESAIPVTATSTSASSTVPSL